VVGQHVYITPVQKVRITGILQDFRIDAPQHAPGPLVFVYGRGGTGGRIVLVRLDSPDAAPFPAMQAVLRDIWGDRMPREFTHVSDLATRAVAEYRARAMIVGLVALACFPLTMIGVGTTLMYAVRLQRKTTAIHLVFGADVRLVQRRTVVRALVWSGAGAALGLGGGIAAGRVMAAYLFGIPALHSPTAAAVVSLIVAAAGCGAAWPAREARRVDLATPLREA
jgi:putative ABC transport system permease protein